MRIPPGLDLAPFAPLMLVDARSRVKAPATREPNSRTFYFSFGGLRSFCNGLTSFSMDSIEKEIVGWFVEPLHLVENDRSGLPLHGISQRCAKSEPDLLLRSISFLFP